MSTQHVYMDAELRPSRSLSPKGYWQVMALILAIAAPMLIYFLFLGMTPIVIAICLSVGITAFGFTQSFKHLSQRTFVRVTASTIDVQHFDRYGRQTCAQMPSAFTRVAVEKTNSDTHNGIRLSNSGKAYLIGRYLTPDEQEKFAESLKQAITNARQERYPLA